MKSKRSQSPVLPCPANHNLQFTTCDCLLHIFSFTIWQLRTSYLSVIKDGIGDRLINVNNSVLNTPGFRAAGWSPALTNPGAQDSTAQVKRTYSPPIPTTATVASEYYRFARYANGEVSDGDGLGIGDEGDEDEGGMVTGGGQSTYTLGTRHHGRGARRNRRRERQQQDHRQGEGEDEDSSDLSDESDEDGEFTQRLVTNSIFVSSWTVFLQSMLTLYPELRSRSSSQRCRYEIDQGPHQFELQIVRMDRKWLKRLCLLHPPIIVIGEVRWEQWRY
jgi:hypothetical protein